MVVTIRLTPSDVKDLREIAEAEHRKLANYVAMVIEQHLARVKKARAKRTKD